jgi:peroxiredoxin Q/BCP
MSRVSAMVAFAMLSSCRARETESSSTSAKTPDQPLTIASAPQAAELHGGLLKIGSKVPDITADAHDGQRVSLRALNGKPLVVYFYPKDDTPGCTVEAQEIRDLWSSLQKANAVVIGVSADDNESHRAFAEKHQLPFLLLADTDQRIARAFGVPLVNGKPKRVSFVVDEAGTVRNVYSDVTPRGHGQELLAAVQTLNSRR